VGGCDQAAIESGQPGGWLLSEKEEASMRVEESVIIDRLPELVI